MIFLIYRYGYLKIICKSICFIVKFDLNEATPRTKTIIFILRELLSNFNSDFSFCYSQKTAFLYLISNYPFQWNLINLN